MKEVPAFKTIILLTGLPAAGKTTFAQFLRESLISWDLQTESVEYDKLEELLTGSEYFQPEKWKESREVAIERTIQFIENHQLDVLILDDNFYYKSMRKPFYQLSRDNRVNYVEI